MRLKDLFEENLIDIENDDIKIENGKMLPNQFPNKVNNFDCEKLKNLTSLENCPQQVEGFFDCYSSGITSLEHAPKIVGGFSCYRTKITSLEHAPKIITGDGTFGGSFNCRETKITSLEHAPLKCGSFFCIENDIRSLKGIGRSYLKECQDISLPNTIQSNILGLCKVNKLHDIIIFDKAAYIKSGKLYEAIEIVKRYLQTDGEDCMEELIQNGYKDYAKF